MKPNWYLRNVPKTSLLFKLAVWGGWLFKTPVWKLTESLDFLWKASWSFRTCWCFFNILKVNWFLRQLLKPNLSFQIRLAKRNWENRVSPKIYGLKVKSLFEKSTNKKVLFYWGLKKIVFKNFYFFVFRPLQRISNWLKLSAF